MKPENIQTSIELYNKIKDSLEEIGNELILVKLNNNKSAIRRARSRSVILRKEIKEWRQQLLKTEKETNERS